MKAYTFLFTTVVERLIIIFKYRVRYNTCGTSRDADTL